MQKNKTRLQDMEILRAFAIIIIVLFHWYLFISVEFFKIDKIFVTNQTIYYASIGLGLFFFVSAYVLYYNYKNLTTFKAITNFYRKRAKRIYPLYWVAFVILILMIYKYTNPDLIIGLLGFQGFYPDTYYINETIFWFIGILLIYYLIYPILIRSKSLINMFSVAAAIFTILALIFLNFNMINLFLFPYYWIFFAGIAVCWLNNNQKKLNFEYRELLLKSLIFIPLLAFSLILIGNISSLVAPLYPHFTIFMQFANIVCILFIFFMVKIFITRVNKSFFQSKIYKLILKISKGSYATYLLHLIIINALLKMQSILNLPVTCITLISIFLGLPLVFIIGYYAQKWELKLIDLISGSYDKYIKNTYDYKAPLKK